MKRKTLLRILRFARPHMAYIVLSLVMAVASVSMTLYAPVLIGDAVDQIIGPGNVDFAGVLAILVRLIWVVAAGAVATWLMGLCTNRAAYSTAREIRKSAFETLENVPLSYIDGRRHGDVISRVVTDVDQISDGLLIGFTQLFSGAVTIVGTLIFMFGLNVRITLIVILVTPISLLVANFVARRTFSMFKAQSETRGEMTSLVEETVGGQNVVKVFSREETCEARFDEINERLRVCGIRALFFSSITNPCTRFVNSIVYACVGVFGAIAAISGSLSVGMLTCFLTYANQYTKPFNEIAGVAAELQSAIASAARVFELIDAPWQEPDAPDAQPLARADGSVEIRDVAFSYRQDVPLIENLNLAAQPGQRIAIVGPTGCGKTTIINLLMRFYDVNRGEIRVSGRDARSLPRDNLRAQFGMVLQDTWLKTGTIRENIAYGRPDATEEEIVFAAKAAHADGFIRRLPQGYDTMVSDEEGGLSQGLRQLLCIARVMLTLPPMLILDEATSSIDTRTESLIQRAFDRMMQGRTSFIVAHRLSTIRGADCILVMRDGHIVEQGRHEELLQKGGFYAELYNSQFAP